MAIFWTSCRNGYNGAKDGRRSPISLLTVEDAVVSFGETRALDGVSLNLDEGETLAIVGESGCGKTTLARAILGLQPLTSGTITLAGRQIKRVEPGQATTLGMVWQDPYASLDPRWTIGRSVLEPVLLSKQNRPVAEILAEVGLDESAGN
ncbi:MAG: ATP-binding cassette domain-containing protein, partial [Chthonomonadaceae bacterium]|nr:ATP-binding cassette domain-containing protein [Chthonomonadaceae bacterium]